MDQRTYFSFLCIGILSIAVSGCTSDSRDAGESTFSDQQTSYSRAGGIKDASYGNVKRVTQSIVVPLGRTVEQLTATLERAARELVKETDADAAMVFAYRPQDTPSGQYSAGRAVYAPNGRWEDAATSAPMRISVDLSDLYFDPPKSQIAIGETVRLIAPDDGQIDLSKEYGSWSEENTIARVPAGTQAVVLERRAEPMGGQEFVRYKVRVNDRGSEVNGWVHASNVQGE